VSKIGNRVLSVRVPTAAESAGGSVKREPSAMQKRAKPLAVTERLWWCLTPGGTPVDGSSPVSWDRLRFLKLRQLMMETDLVCPDDNRQPVLADKTTFKELFASVATAASTTEVMVNDSELDAEYHALAEELLLRPVGWPNSKRCPLEFLTCHETVAWEIPGVKVPRIGCKNYWVPGRGGGSSDWTE
jgi:hypothetical protein